MSDRVHDGRDLMQNDGLLHSGLKLCVNRAGTAFMLSNGRIVGWAAPAVPAEKKASA